MSESTFIGNQTRKSQSPRLVQGIRQRGPRGVTRRSRERLVRVILVRLRRAQWRRGVHRAREQRRAEDGLGGIRVRGRGEGADPEGVGGGSRARRVRPTRVACARAGGIGGAEVGAGGARDGGAGGADAAGAGDDTREGTRGGRVRDRVRREAHLARVGETAAARFGAVGHRQAGCAVGVQRRSEGHIAESARAEGDQKDCCEGSCAQYECAGRRRDGLDDECGRCGEHSAKKVQQVGPIDQMSDRRVPRAMRLNFEEGQD